MRTELKVAVTIVHSSGGAFSNDKLCGITPRGSSQREPCPYERPVGSGASSAVACGLFHSLLDTARHRCDACLQAEGSTNSGNDDNLLTALLKMGRE